MLKTLFVLTIAFFLTGPATAKRPTDSKADQAAIDKTSEAVRAAFARGDVPAILSYHHPDVTQALAYHKYLVGRTALEVYLLAPFENYALEFQQNDVESLTIHGDIAVEQILFSVKGTPKKGGAPFLVKGRTMLVLVRYDQSPTGWATLRETVQPG